ncbi:MAG: hypothetical protein A3B66_06940 [Alphaproteobacteria bacterium RIFCSPHIGHO2_02_FULL_46_13]|nr:MAG: hypothetical protein A3B66_06940 [Alphaproteobacteria bacterium RIFCSPHIGHO2_02_FULL_46_13]
MQDKNDITLAKGLCMLLVVTGHTLAGGVSIGNEWFSDTVVRLYLFHMPFFMFLSGFLYFRPGRVESIRAKYWDHAGKQAVRLLLPFFFLGIVVLVGKFAMQNIVHVDNVPESFSSGLVKLFWETDRSPAMFIWYIYVLFFYTVLSPLIYPYFKDKFGYWIALGLIIYFLPYVHYLYMDRIAQYFIFFVIGGAIRQNEAKYLNVIDRKYLLWTLIPVFFAILILVPFKPYLHSPLGMLIVGLMSIPILHGLARRIMSMGRNVSTEINPLAQFFMTIGVYSYVIYLFNVITIGVIKGVLFKFTDWNGWHFWYFMPILIAGAIIGSILAEKLVLQHLPFIRNNILGRSDKQHAIEKT